MGTSGEKERKNEAYIENKPIDIDVVIEMRKSICKIIVKKKKETLYGTGFFMKDFYSKRYLITNYHVLDLDSLNEKIEIEIWNKKIFVLSSKKINIKYLKEPKDITALELEALDEIDEILKEVSFLAYDKNYEDGYLAYKDADVFTIEHPFGKSAKCSSGKIKNINEYEFEHNIATEYGSSGCPILLLNDNINFIKVIGIHKNSYKDKKVNGGTFIGEIINKIKNDSQIKVNKDIKSNNYIIAEIFIKEDDVNKNIRIINSYEEYMRNEKPNSELDKDRMNEKEIKKCEIKINDELIPFNYYYQFKKEGKFIIKYSFKNHLIKANDLFNKCEYLIKVDLSNFKITDSKNTYLMFNGIDKLKEIRGINKFITNKIENIEFKNFHIINNTIPEVNTNNLHEFILRQKKINNLSILKKGYNDEGYQIFKLKKNTLIGLLEGPPNTAYENGYFLFKILFPKDFPFIPPQFIFITKIFHPNISEKGIVSVDFLRNEWNDLNKWAVPLWPFPNTIYSIQSLLDDPNPDDFLNEKAAILFKKDRRIYDETVRCYTFLFANYSQFLEDIKNMNITVRINKGNSFIFSEENEN